MTENKGRGRPKTGNAKTDAQRSKAYRERQKEKLDKVNQVNTLIIETEELKKENITLKQQIKVLKEELEKLKISDN